MTEPFPGFWRDTRTDGAAEAGLSAAAAASAGVAAGAAVSESRQGLSLHPEKADASQADLHDHNQMQVLHAKLACIPVATERANAVKTLSFLYKRGRNFDFGLLGLQAHRKGLIHCPPLLCLTL